MNSPVDPLRDAVIWLSTHARFPTSRMEKRAETLLCIGILAATNEEEERRRFLIQSRDPKQTSALRAHGLRRSQVHFKCDNSAKV